LEDLWAFNEEAVARAIVACPVPVVSAVGHEMDVTIADLVADSRAPTPSAAAEMVVQEGGALLEGIRRLPQRMSRALAEAARRRRRFLGDHRVRLERSVERILTPRRQAVDRGLDRLERTMSTVLARHRGTLASVGGKLDALSPLATLRRGYAVPLDSEGRVLRSVRNFGRSDSFTLRVVDGRVDCSVLDSHLEKGDGA
jgi:exodeoxyribonuclease VII large subunit